MVFEEVERTAYLEQLLAYRDDYRLIKVITGVRRCGKSTLLRQYQRRLAESGVDESDILNINFESARSASVRDKDSLMGFLYSRVPENRRFYLFLDEVQMVDGWEDVVRALNVDTKADIYVTGSNAYLLSSEISTYLTGRYVTIDMMPLSFAEFFGLNGRGRDAYTVFEEYMRTGGFPVLDPSDGDDRCETTLTDIRSSIIGTDILTRLGVRNASDVEKMVDYLMVNVGNQISTGSISRDAGISRPTAEKYLDMLCKAFMFYRVDKYDIRSTALSPSPKYYPVDVGLRNVSVTFGRQDRGRVLENLVYLELRRRGYRIQAGSWNSREVDFVIEKTGEGRTYVQVCLDISDDDTEARELAPLRAIRDNFPKLLLVKSGWPSSCTEDGILIRNVADWMLDRS